MVEPVKGVEPLTCGLRNRCSATELHRLEKQAQILPGSQSLQSKSWCFSQYNTKLFFPQVGHVTAFA